MPRNRRLTSSLSRPIVLFLVLLPALFVILRGWNGFAYPSTVAPYSDLTLSHFTFIDYIRQQLLENYTFPLWFPAILSGTAGKVPSGTVTENIIFTRGAGVSWISAGVVEFSATSAPCW